MSKKISCGCGRTLAVHNTLNCGPVIPGYQEPNVQALIARMGGTVSPTRLALYILDTISSRATMMPEARSVVMNAADHVRRADRGSSVDAALKAMERETSRLK